MALTTNLVAYYKLDESSGNASDSSGNGFTLTASNSPSFVAGFINNSADLGNDGTVRGFSISNNLGLSGNGAKSFSFWVKMKSEPSSNFDFFVGQSNASTNSTLDFDYNDSGGTKHIRFSKYCAGTSTEAKIQYDVTLGTSGWHHFVGTTDGSTLKMYLDGSAVGGTVSDFSASGSDGYPDRFQIGNNNTSHFIIDEVGVWSRALTSDEVTSLYNSGAGLQYPFSTTSSQNAKMLQLF